MQKRIRSTTIKRKTTETDITGRLVIDGKGKSEVKTGIGFLDHMLTLFTFHGLFDLTLKAKGDLDVDIHHTNEDIAISLGKAFKDALGDCKGIRRYGSAELPMDEAIAKVTVDVGGRYTFVFKPEGNLGSMEGYDINDGKDFLDTFAKNAAINLHVRVLFRGDFHHGLEAVFKALGVTLDQATQVDIRRKGIPSTKGII